MTDLQASPLLYTARPRVAIDGADAPSVGDGVVGLSTHENADGLCRCELTVGNWGRVDGALGPLYFGRDLLEFGRELEVSAGDGDSGGPLFKGRISALEARFAATRPHELTVLAEDVLQDLRMTRRTRVFEDVGDRDVFEAIAQGHGLTTDIDVDAVDGQRIVAQLNQSDLAFMRERARAIDAELWIEDGTLRIAARSRRPERVVSLTLGRRLRDFIVNADLAHQCTGFRVGGWDVGAKSELDETADDSVITGEVEGSGQTGAAVLRDAFGERIEQIVHAAPATQAEARALAEAHFRRRARRFVTGRGNAEGDARIRVGVQLNLAGIGELFDGLYTVVEVRHTFDDQHGFRTCFAVERPGLGR